MASLLNDKSMVESQKVVVMKDDCTSMYESEAQSPPADPTSVFKFKGSLFSPAQVSIQDGLEGKSDYQL